MIGSKNSELIISYSEKDLTTKGKHHNGPLHIIVDSMGKRIPMVLIDNGSALIVYPLKTVSYFDLSIEDFLPIDQHVRAYDNSKRSFGNFNIRAYHRTNGQEGGFSSP